MRIILAIVALSLSIAPSIAQTARPDGAVLYQDNCGRCHGGSLEGQPDWMTRLPNGRLPAPPHDSSGHTWHHSDDQLLRIIRDGLAAIAPGYETDMPAFGNSLTDEEIIAILDFIKQDWPERERSYQQKR
ncbi:MAG: c-type cytochrome [Alphaproteobacteria bacterium]|nr:c-type cytochrome [Alphaproteobacteria bacterium]